MDRKCTVMSNKIEEDNKIIGFQFKFHIHEKYISPHAPPQAIARLQLKGRILPAIKKEFTILVPDKSKWVSNYLETHPSEEHIRLLTAEILAQKFCVQSISIDHNSKHLELITQTLLSHIEIRETWFQTQPPWFHLEDDTDCYEKHKASCCETRWCNSFMRPSDKSNRYCPTCGEIKGSFSTPIINESIYSCTNPKCTFHGKMFDSSHKRCHECGEEVNLIFKIW
jgi:hypothetical protein